MFNIINAINFYKQRKRYEEMKQAHENSTNLTDDDDQDDDDSLDPESKILLSPPIQPQVKLPYIKGGVNAVSKHDSMTPLHLACRHHQTSVVDLLLQHQDVQVNKLTKQGKHSISIAAEKGYNDIVKLLVNHPNVNLNTTNSSAQVNRCFTMQQPLEQQKPFKYCLRKELIHYVRCTLPVFLHADSIVDILMIFHRILLTMKTEHHCILLAKKDFYPLSNF